MSKYVLRLLVSAALVASLGPWYAGAQAPAKQATAQKTKAHRAKPRASKPEPPPQTPPPPPTPEQMPAVAPQVVFQNGMLTIVAPNSRLGDVLKAVSMQTGARLDLPAGAANQRVVANLGPAPAQQVLSDLLDGSKFDYVVLGSARRPGGIDQITLSPATNVPAVTAMAGAQPPRQAVPAAQQEEPDENIPDEGGEPEQNVQPVEPEQQAPPEAQQEQQEQQQPGQPQAIPPQQQGQEQQQPGQEQQPPGQEQQQNPAQPKTPEQLLQELQRMQQQQQQQQQQETPK